MDSALRRLALELHDCGAFKTKHHKTAVTRADGERGFRLKMHEQHPEEPLSPFYLDLRALLPALVSTCGRELFNLAERRSLEFDCLVGLPKAGEPFSNAMAACWPKGERKPVLHLRKAEKNGKRQITGPLVGLFNPGQIVLPIDDVITRAETKLEAIDVLRRHGLIVKDVLVVVDRQQGGEKELQDCGCQLHALFRLEELLKVYIETERITPVLQEEIWRYANRPV